MEHLITDYVLQYGYLAVFVLMVLESACIPVPSEVTMLFGGALANGAFLASLGQQGVELCRAETPGDGAVRPGDQHHLGVRQVGEVGPLMPFGQHGHAQDQRVHAGEQLTPGPQHPRDLRGEVLRHEVPGQCAVLGDHAVRAAVGEERQAAGLGHHRGDPARRCPPVPGGGRARQGRDHPDHRVPGPGRLCRAARPRPGDVHKQPPPRWEPRGELGLGHRPLELPIRRERAWPEHGQRAGRRRRHP